MRRHLKSILLPIVLILIGIAAGFRLHAHGQAGAASPAAAPVAPADTAALRTQYEQWREDF
jgi:hypothetical protein